MKYMFKIYYLVTIMEDARILALIFASGSIRLRGYNIQSKWKWNTCKEMFKLNYTPSDHPCKLQVALQVPVPFPPYMSSKLDIPRLDCNTSCMDGQKVGILHDCHQIVLRSLMEGLHCTSCPLEWTFVDPPRCQLLVSEVGGIPCWCWHWSCICMRCHIASTFSEWDLSHEPAIPNNNSIKASFDTHDI